MRIILSAVASIIFLAIFLLIVAGTHWCCGKDELDAWIILAFLVGYVGRDFYQTAVKHFDTLTKTNATK